MIYEDDKVLIVNAPRDLKDRFESKYQETQSLFEAAEYAWQTDIVWYHTEAHLKDILFDHGVDWIHRWA